MIRRGLLLGTGKIVRQAVLPRLKQPEGKGLRICLATIAGSGTDPEGHS